MPATGADLTLSTLTGHADSSCNRAAEFLPARSPDQRPALRVGDAQVSVYWEVGVLRVTIDTADVDTPGDCAVWVEVEDGTVYRRPATPAQATCPHPGAGYDDEWSCPVCGAYCDHTADRPDCDRNHHRREVTA